MGNLASATPDRDDEERVGENIYQQIIHFRHMKISEYV